MDKYSGDYCINSKLQVSLSHQSSDHRELKETKEEPIFWGIIGFRWEIIQLLEFLQPHIFCLNLAKETVLGKEFSF